MRNHVEEDVGGRVVKQLDENQTKQLGEDIEIQECNLSWHTSSFWIFCF